MTIPAGTYRIIVADRAGVQAEAAEVGIKPRAEYLTNAKWVTIEHARGAQPDSEQEWRIVLRNKDYIIERVSKEFPSKYITYKGVPAKPKEGARVELEISGFPGPLSAWQFKPSKAKHTYRIVVAGSENFGIAVAPQEILPPFLELSSDPERHVEWKFERVESE